MPLTASRVAASVAATGPKSRRPTRYSIGTVAMASRADGNRSQPSPSASAVHPWRNTRYRPWLASRRATRSHRSPRPIRALASEKASSDQRLLLPMPTSTRAATASVGSSTAQGGPARRDQGDRAAGSTGPVPGASPRPVLRCSSAVDVTASGPSVGTPRLYVVTSAPGSRRRHPGAPAAPPPARLRARSRPRPILRRDPRSAVHLPMPSPSPRPRLPVLLGALLAGSAGAGHLLYPAVLGVVSGRRPRPEPPAEPEAWPPLTAVVPAYREAGVIADKVADLRANGYAGSLAIVVVAEDGETACAAREAGATVVEPRERLGKAQAVNLGVAEAGTDLVVLTDANNRLAPGSLALLVRHLLDPRVGAVAGEKVEADAGGEELYWRFESWLKQREWALGTTIGIVGELVGLRRSAWHPIPRDISSDDL